MPHFSPMNWIITSMIFWFFLLITLSQIWWSNSPNFTPVSSSLDKSFSTWSWS